MILGVGGLAMLIPPSALAVLLGTLARIDVGQLLIAGVVPGLILAGLYATLILALVTAAPHLAPTYEVAPTPLLTKLRLVELIIFGCPAIFFFVQTWQQSTYLANLADGSARLDNIVTPWLLLIFTYALFIPNTWQRAAAVIAVMGLMPLALLGWLWFNVPAVARLAGPRSRTRDGHDRGSRLGVARARLRRRA